ncbi:MAG: hypothetical protein AB7S38_10255 [Vulcanimicrobiota bacterium]
MNRLLWVSLWVLWVTLPGFAREVEFYPTFGEFTRTGCELPVSVVLANPRSAAYTYHLRLSPADERARARADVQVEAQSTRRIDMVAPAGYISRLELDWGVKNPPAVDMRQVSERDLLMLILAPKGTEFGYLGGFESLKDDGENYKRQVFMNRPQAVTALPERWSSYDMHNLIILHDVPALNLEQRAQQAMLDWTVAGGSLVLVSNGSPGEYRGSLFEAVAPMEGRTSVEAGGLPLLSGQLRGEVLQELDGHPLLTRRALGLGQIFLVTAPLVEGSTLGLDKTEKLWLEIEKRFRNPAQLDSSLLDNPPEIPLPRASSLAWYLLAYAFLVGPLNLVWLRRRDQTMRAFVTIPLIAVLFAGGAFVFNWSQRDNRMVAREMGILWGDTGSTRALVRSRLLLFSPVSRSYRIEFGPQVGVGSLLDLGSGIDDFPDVLLNDKLGLVLDDYQMAMWSVRRLDLSEVVGLPGRFQVKLEGNRLEAFNPLEAPLYHTVVRAPAGYSQAFTLEPGQHSYDLKWEASFPESRDADQQKLVRSALPALEGDRVAILGWLDGMLTPVELAGLEKHTASRLLVITEDK